jgi:hypothetical protein
MQGDSMRRNLVRLIAVLASTFACALSGSPLTSTWRVPEAGRPPFRRVLATFVSTDQAMRRSMEDRLATKVPSSFAAYRAVPGLSLNDRELARQQLRGKLFDGVVVMRVVDVRNVQSFRGGSTWYANSPTFSDYWRSSWAIVRDPAYLVSDRYVFVETVLYSLADDKLLWAGRTSAENPRSVNELVDRTVDAVAKELRGTELVR